MREPHSLCNEHGDVASASLLENRINEAERRIWFLYEAVVRAGPAQADVGGLAERRPRLSFQNTLARFVRLYSDRGPIRCRHPSSGSGRLPGASHYEGVISWNGKS